MSRMRVDNTIHGTERSKERTLLPKKQRERMIREAQRHGRTWRGLAEGPLQYFVYSKGEKKRVKYFCGYIFVFQKTSTSLITMYPVPEEILEAQKEFEAKGLQEQ